MSDKLIQNNDEVAYNEDINDIQDLTARSYNGALEGIQYYDISEDHGAGSYFIPLRILGGFEVVFAANGTLTFSIGNGEALVAHDETTELDSNIWASGHFINQSKRNNVQQARHSSFVSGVFPYVLDANADPTKDRIDLIEIKFDRVESSENRYKLVTIDNRRVAQLVNVDKYSEYVMSDVRIRKGNLVDPPVTPLYNYGPRMPALDPDASVPAQLEWLPIAAVYVPANTAGFSSQPSIVDLRLFYQPRMANGLVNGPMQPLNITTIGDSMAVPFTWYQWIVITKNAIIDGGECFPIAGTSKNSQTENPLVGWHSVSMDLENHSSFVEESIWSAIAIDTLYYMYSFRASPRIGTTGLCMSNKPPCGFHDAAIYGKAGNPFYPISPPAPWPNRYSYIDPNNPLSGTLGAYIKEHAHYLSSFKCYMSSLDSHITPRPFKKYGNYVSLTGEDCVPATGGTSIWSGTDDNCIFYGTITTTAFHIIKAYTNPAANETTPPGTTQVVPSHAAAIRVAFTTSWTSGTGSVYLEVKSEEGEYGPPLSGVCYNIPVAVSVTDDALDHAPKTTVFDITLQPGLDTLFWLQVTASAAVSALLKIYVLGYYEQF